MVEDNMTSLEVGLLQEVGKNFHQIKDFSTGVTRNAVNTVTQTVERAVNSVSETTHNAKASLTQTAAKAVNMFNEATSKTIHTVTKTAEQAQDKITQTAVSAIDNVNSTTKNTSTSLENSLTTFINKQLHGVRGWIDSHPVMSWATEVLIWGISHPILSVIMIILGIFILGRFIKALSQFLEQFFLYTLQAPFKFGQVLLGLCLKLFSYLPFLGNTLKQSEGNMLALNTSIAASVSQNNKERLAYILNRLEAIRQEQNQLLQEVTAILASSENSR
ncbi:hypothetical protein [Argonema galeatum]|uniref:hypothetical protein n=1 Tax=Argonema galeatum TaxID=2942762 RepID=UPI002013AE12|nr:hypothetical protein [Argonema galeatum]MCL1466922.1 hypothetical protein [Argonema galeatum A003/A1]